MPSVMADFVGAGVVLSVEINPHRARQMDAVLSKDGEARTHLNCFNDSNFSTVHVENIQHGLPVKHGGSFPELS